MATSQLENTEAAPEVTFAIPLSSSPSPKNGGSIDGLDLSSIANDAGAGVGDERFCGAGAGAGAGLTCRQISDYAD